MRLNVSTEQKLLAVYVLGISSVVVVALANEEASLKICYHETLLECPRYSMCSRVNSTNSQELKCLCLQHFQYNPKWQETQNTTSGNSTHEVDNNYCIPSSLAAETEENKVIVYIRSATNPRHLVFGITLVLLAVTLATSLLYGLKVLRPIKRTKAAYKRLLNRRQNMTPLHEMDELELNRRYEMETYLI